jgi:predicted XRE-type DNA-binding protein
MVNVDELRGYIVKKGMSQRRLAPKLGMTETTFYNKMKIGIFGSDEIENMISELDMPYEDASRIFFNLQVT